VAARYDATPGQVALAWVLAQGNDVAPIPGTKRRKYLEENVAALQVELSAADVEALAKLTPVGNRYPDMNWVAGQTAPRD
jgi:aryl-alcohol dehydrogenase-like predicted oxidoreductase